MPVVVQNDVRQVAVERLNNADCIWSDVAIPYGDRVSLTLPSAFRGRSVQILYFPLPGLEGQPWTVSENGSDDMAVALEELPRKYAKGNWNGYGEQPLNDNSYRCAKEFAAQLPAAFRKADVGIDADGEVTIEWYRSKDCQSSLTFAASGNVYCIVRSGGDRITAIVSSKAVGKILDLISEVVNG